VAGVRHHQNDWGEPAEPPDKNSEDHHSDARQRSFAHGAFVRLCEYSVKRATEICDDGVRANLRQRSADKAPRTPLA
jgi:hypothetical protein